MVLADNIGNILTKLVAFGQFRALFDVRKQNKCTHGGGQFVVLVGAAKLVFNKVFGVRKLANVVVQGRNLAQQAVGANGLGSGLYHVGDHKRVVIRAGHGNHKLLHERLLKAHELHEAETRAVAKRNFKHRANGKQQNERKYTVDEHGQQLHGHDTRRTVGKQGCAKPDDGLPDGERYNTPHHVLAALGICYKPCGKHAAKKMQQKERKRRLKHEHGKE